MGTVATAGTTAAAVQQQPTSNTFNSNGLAGIGLLVVLSLMFVVAIVFAFWDSPVEPRHQGWGGKTKS